MNEQSQSGERTVFRAGTHLYILVGILMSFFIVLFTAVTVKKPDQWPVLAVIVGLTVLFFLLLSYWTLAKKSSVEA
jgi:hypothetical protein